MKNIIKNIMTRMRLILSRGIVSSIDDTKEIQSLNIECLDSEYLRAVERLQEYGLSTVPPEESNAVVGSLTGDRANSTVLKMDYPQGRPKDKAEGDVTLWDIHGNTIELTAEGIKITGVGKTSIDDSEVIINGGTKGAARLDDTVSRTLSVPDLIAIGTALAPLYLPAVPPVPPSTPVTLIGEAKIDSASTSVKIGD